MIIFFLGAVFSSIIIFALLLSHILQLRLIKVYPSTSKFSVAVVIPCKGDGDPKFGENLLSIIHQVYTGLVQFIFCVESQADSALPVLCRLKEQFARIHICVAGMATQSSQKTHNILRGMTLADKVDIFLFADADIQPHPTWLQEMVAPFSDPQIGVTTGCFRRVPITAGFQWGNYLAGLFGAGIVAGMTNNQIKGLWGGSLAIRASIVDRFQLRERLATEIVDDIAITHAIRRQHNIERCYIQSCTLKSYCNMSVGESIEWLARQLQFSQIYLKGLYAFYYVVFTPYVLSILAAPLIFIYGLVSANWLAVSASAGFWLSVMMVGFMLWRGIPINPASVSSHDTNYRLLLWMLVTPIAFVCGLVALLKTLFRVKGGVLTMYWRNIQYRVDIKTGKVLEVIR